MNNLTNESHKFSKSLLALMVSASLSGTVYAAEETKKDEVKASGIEVIQVTATKRSQSLEDVPVSAVVKTGKMLEQGGMDRVTDLQYSIPGFVMTGQDNSGWVQMTMRGISTPSVSSGFSLGTGMYIDGVEQGPPIAFNQELVGIDQVEVLRGPQGTLFGKNTIAGAFNITTTKPTQDFEGYVSLDLGNYNENNFEAVVNGALSDELSARATLFTRKHDGYVENTFTGGDVNNQDQIGGKLQLRFEPSDDLTMDLSVDFMEEDRNFAYHEVSAPLNGAPSDGNGGWDWYGTDPASVNTINQIPDGQNTISHTFDDTEKRQLWGIQFNVDYALSDELTFTSITGIRHGLNDIFEDTDHTSWNEANYTSYKTFDQMSQEFRIASEAASVEGEWDYLVGVYLSSLSQVERLSYGSYEDSGIMSGALQVPGTATPLLLTSTADIASNTLAIFGSSNYYVTDDFSLNLGLRIGRENKDIGIEEHSGGWIPDTPLHYKSYGETNVSPTVGFGYTLTENANVYGKVTQGFKSGGFNTAIFKFENTDIVFDSESVISYELGIKGDAFGRHLTYGVAAYFMDYSDLQVEIYVPLGDGLAGKRLVRNAADAEISGFEAEMSFMITDDLVANLGYAYTDATYSNFIDTNPASPFDYSGNQLPNSPKSTGNANLTYMHSFESAELSATLDYTYRGEWYSFSSNNENEKNEGYSLVNARIGVELENGLEISLYGKNLTDEQYTTETWQLGGLSQERKGFYRPRTYGVNFTYRFY